MFADDRTFPGRKTLRFGDSIRQLDVHHNYSGVRQNMRNFGNRTETSNAIVDDEVGEHRGPGSLRAQCHRDERKAAG
ncbi:hypothetical protein GCM10011380_08250 [Sphingomonas metalli]|uniref:Uncharacterized protein n=2 Tax=Sphingomonas metalli TaxID=1779358 RepID=A0A916SZN2_9SPHN|nr:hypothetical protein GCM10011380_08250 [Sphingomonas metalli]